MICYNKKTKKLQKSFLGYTLIQIYVLCQVCRNPKQTNFLSFMYLLEFLQYT